MPAYTPDPGSPIGDPARLAAVRRTGLLDAMPSDAFDRLVRMTVRATGAPTALVTLVDAERQVVLSAAGLGDALAGGRETPLSQSVCRHVVERGGPLVVEDAQNVTVLEHPGLAGLDARAYAGMPLTSRDGHVLGALCAIDHAPRRWTQEDLDALADLADSVMTEIELRRLTHQLVTDTRTDPVTGLGNRRTWDEEAPKEVARARRFGHTLVLALLDIDRFRRFNDRYGNQAGDALLREITFRWSDRLRDVDVLLRLGGVEFAVLMPATGLDPAFDVVERLRADLTSGLTCAAGLAMLRDGEDGMDLLARADAALVRAKRSGRNASALAS